MSTGDLVSGEIKPDSSLAEWFASEDAKFKRLKESDQEAIKQFIESLDEAGVK